MDPEDIDFNTFMDNVNTAATPIDNPANITSPSFVGEAGSEPKTGTLPDMPTNNGHPILDAAIKGAMKGGSTGKHSPVIMDSPVDLTPQQVGPAQTMGPPTIPPDISDWWKKYHSS